MQDAAHMPGPELAIDLRDVAKTYPGKVQALRGVSMRVNRGEIFGLLGPNGAGKSTLVKVLTTVIRPSKAEGTVLGSPLGDKETLARVGYLPEHHRFPEYLTGRQVLDFYGAMSRVPRAVRKKRAEELLGLVGMTAWAGAKVRSYSKGMRQRLGLAQALMNEPELVILDEPTDGVDPVGRRDIRAIVSRLKEKGMSVLLNSHLLSELEMVCDRVAILVQGVVASQGTIDELTREHRRYEIEIEAADPAAAFRAALPTGKLPTGEGVEISGGTLRVGTNDAARVQGVLDALRRSGVTVRALKPTRPSLEDLFMQAVTDPSSGRARALGAKR